MLHGGLHLYLNLNSSKHATGKRCIQNLPQNLKVREYEGNINVDRRIILKYFRERSVH
jgi:hypothetical protein